MGFVLDASMTLAWIFHDEKSDLANKVRDRLYTEEAVVPTLWSLEVGNALLVACKRKRLKAAEIPQLIQYIQALPIRFDAATGQAGLGASLQLAHRYSLSLYDAAYLELAQRLGLPLATLDSDLKKAAKQIRLAVLP